MFLCLNPFFSLVSRIYPRVRILEKENVRYGKLFNVLVLYISLQLSTHALVCVNLTRFI